jgi:hypothetical protein
MLNTCSTVVSWDAFYRRWRSLEPPLRPDPDVCHAIGGAIANHASRVLVLGVTPELADLGSRTVALDWSTSAVTRIWPGDASTRRAIQADWQQMPCANGAMTAAIGDGSLNCLSYPSGYERLFRELTRTLRPGARIAVRVYLRPDDCESIAAISARVMAGGVETVHAFKWLLAMAICHGSGDSNVEVRRILRVFNDQFRDRAALCRVTGWTGDVLAEHLDVYGQLADVFSFPTAGQLLATCGSFVRPQLVHAGSYELADRCPVLIMDVPS